MERRKDAPARAAGRPEHAAGGCGGAAAGDGPRVAVGHGPGGAVPRGRPAEPEPPAGPAGVPVQAPQRARDGRARVLREQAAHDHHGQAGAGHDVAGAQGHGGEHPAGVAGVSGPAAGEPPAQAEPEAGAASGQPVRRAVRVPGLHCGGRGVAGRHERDPAVQGPPVSRPADPHGGGSAAHGGLPAGHVPTPAPALHLQEGPQDGVPAAHHQVPLRGQPRCVQHAVHALCPPRRGAAQLPARLPRHVQPRVAGRLLPRQPVRPGHAPPLRRPGQRLARARPARRPGTLPRDPAPV